MQKNLWPVLIVTIVLGTAVFIGFRSASRPQEIKATAVAPGSVPASPDPTITSTPSPLPASSSSPSPASKSPPPSSQPVHTAVTTLSALQRINAEIDAAAADSTPESLALLVSYASNDNADIRTPALNGLVLRGDADAAPFLRAAAKKTDSSDTAIALLKTADYLELPAATLREITSRPKVPKEKPPVNPQGVATTTKPATPDPEDKP